MVNPGRTGEFINSVAGGKAVRAFVPSPFPPELPLQFTSERRRYWSGPPWRWGAWTVSLCFCPIRRYSSIPVYDARRRSPPRSKAPCLRYRICCNSICTKPRVCLSMMCCRYPTTFERWSTDFRFWPARYPVYTGSVLPGGIEKCRIFWGYRIVREITGRQRSRIFSYQAFLDILNEGAESV